MDLDAGCIRIRFRFSTGFAPVWNALLNIAIMAGCCATSFACTGFAPLPYEHSFVTIPALPHSPRLVSGFAGSRLSYTRLRILPATVLYSAAADIPASWHTDISHHRGFVLYALAFRPSRASLPRAVADLHLHHPPHSSRSSTAASRLTALRRGELALPRLRRPNQHRRSFCRSTPFRMPHAGLCSRALCFLWIVSDFFDFDGHGPASSFTPSPNTRFTALLSIPFVALLNHYPICDLGSSTFTPGLHHMTRFITSARAAPAIRRDAYHLL